MFVEVRDSSDSMSSMADAGRGEEIESDDPIFQDIDDVEIGKPMPASPLQTVRTDEPGRSSQLNRTDEPSGSAQPNCRAESRLGLVQETQPASSSSSGEIDTHVHYVFTYEGWYSQVHEYDRPSQIEFEGRAITTFAASTEKYKSRISKAHIFRCRHRFKVPMDVHFYKPQEDERADQPPKGMIAVNEQVLEAGLKFPLHPAITHLLVAWNLSIN